MREYINIVNSYLMEARPPTGSRTGTRTRPADDILGTPGIEQPLATTPRGALPATPGTPSMGTTTASAADVRMRAGLPPQAAGMMGDFMSRDNPADEISDEEARRRAGGAAAAPAAERPELPRNPENLPAVIRNELMARSDREYPDTWEPRWTMVRHLPGYMQNAIRAMGRQVFQQFTNTSLEDIQVMASPMINTDHDMDRMMAFISRNGIRDDAATMDFERSIPGYQADVALYRMADYEFLVVRDFAGKYIYGWPGGRGVHIAGGTRNNPRLG